MIKKNILITGGAGTIGIELVRLLSKKNFNVSILDLPEQIKVSRKFIPKNVKIYEGSILDKSLLIRAITKKQIIVHLAASLGVKNTEENSYRCYQINVRGTENILDICLQKKIKKFIFASSSEVYGEPLNNPIDENFPTQGKSNYAITKLMGESLVKSYNDLDKSFKYIIFRFFNTYGINQVAQFVLPKFIHAAQNGKNLVINGDGEQIRSYCSAVDIARGISNSISNRKANNQIINLGNSLDSITLNDLAKLVLNKTKSKSKIVYDRKFKKTDRKKSREVYKRFGNFDKAKKLINFKANIRLEKGLEDLIKKQIRENWPNEF